MRQGLLDFMLVIVAVAAAAAAAAVSVMLSVVVEVLSVSEVVGLTVAEVLWMLLPSCGLCIQAFFQKNSPFIFPFGLNTNKVLGNPRVRGTASTERHSCHCYPISRCTRFF